MTTYKIIRFYSDNRESEIIEINLSLKEVQEHCNNPETSGTLNDGTKHFDVYQEEV